MARQCAAAAGPWSKKRLTAADFLFDWDGSGSEQSPLDMLAEARAYHLAHNAWQGG